MYDKGMNADATSWIKTFRPDISLFTTEPALDLEQASRYVELQAG